MHLLRIILALLALLAVCRPLACVANEGGVYAYVDDQGALFISNVPDDARYQLLIPGEIKAQPHAAQAGQKYPQRFTELIDQVAAQYGIEAALLHAVITVESGYNPAARSRRGAAGLMQLMPDTAKRFGVSNVFDPAENVRGGAQYLVELLKLFNNDLRLALAAYNAGEKAVIKYRKRIPPYPETVAYVPRIVDYYQRYRVAM